MDYEQALEYLNKCHKYGVKRGHKQLRKLLNLFDNSDRKSNIIHVAGTNGKGSTCVMLASILKSAGYKTGLFTSPHLEEYNERFIINDEYISNCDFAKNIENISIKIKELFNSSNEFFSFFEVLTVMAFNYFYEKNVDYLIIETGMGGRLDATNVIEKPLLSIITSISYDHMQYLGNTITDIAFEKSGIIKKNLPVVLYSQSKKVYNVINNNCNNKNSELFYLENYNFKIISENLDTITFMVNNKFFSYNKLKIKMIGHYQIYNACNVLLAIEVMKIYGINISNNSIIEGLENAFIKGRMEIISKNPFIIIDGAHNVDAALQFNLFLKKFKLKTAKKIVIIIGMLKDKQYKNIVNVIIEPADVLILTQPKDERTLNCLDLYNFADKKNKTIYIESDYKKAVDTALIILNNDSCLFCTGSLYLIGNIRKYFMEVSK